MQADKSLSGPTNPAKQNRPGATVRGIGFSDAEAERAATSRKPGAKMDPARGVLEATAALAQQVDDLLALRDLLKRSQVAERQMTAEIVAAITASGRDRLEGDQAVAVLGQRESLAVDPQLFLEHTGPKGFVAITVSVTKAREFLGEEDLRGIAETTTTPVLTVRERLK